MEIQERQDLAEQIARLLQTGAERSDDNLRCSTLEKISRRLDEQNPKTEVRSSPVNHYSQEKFINLAELADEIFNGFQTEKICPFEPAGKLCDHCSMCNSRGF